jgi:hypothetical protein
MRDGHAIIRVLDYPSPPISKTLIKKVIIKFPRPPNINGMASLSRLITIPTARETED